MKKKTLNVFSFIAILLIVSSASYALDLAADIDRRSLIERPNLDGARLQLWSDYQKWANSIKPDFRGHIVEVCLAPAWGNYVDVTATIGIENIGGNYGLNYNPAYRKDIPNFIEFSGSLYRSSVVYATAPLRGEIRYVTASASFPYYGGNGQLPSMVSAYVDAQGYYPHPAGWGGVISELDEYNNYSYKSTSYLFYNPPYPAVYKCWN